MCGVFSSYGERELHASCGVQASHCVASVVAEKAVWASVAAAPGL